MADDAEPELMIFNHGEVEGFVQGLKHVSYETARSILEEYGHRVVQRTPSRLNGACRGEVSIGHCTVCKEDAEACWIEPARVDGQDLHCTSAGCIITATLQGGGYGDGSAQVPSPTFCDEHIPSDSRSLSFVNR